MANMTRRNFLKTGVTAAVGGSMLLAVGGVPALAEEAPLKVRAAVFSPTGGSMNATYMLASLLTDEPEMIDQTSLASREKEITFAKDELCIMTAPCYAGRIPYAPNLFTNLKGDGTPCIVVGTYGNRACENNCAQLQKIATDNGFVVIGAIELITPHIFAAIAGHSRPDMKDLVPMRKFADAILEKIKTGNLTTITVEGDPSPSPQLAIFKEHVIDPEKCVKCGLCAASCPTGAIDPATIAADPAKCIACQHCTFACPVSARTFVSDWNASDAKYFAPRKEIKYVV